MIAHASRSRLDLSGKLVDVLNPELPVLDGARLEPGSSGLYRDASDAFGGPGGRNGAARRPRVLHATHRLIEDRFDGTLTRATVRGPAGTPAVVRIDRAGRPVREAKAQDGRGNELPVESREDGPTFLARFPNVPDGAVLEVRWGEP